MKNLLTENEIRKMMKYANINKLADGFVDRLTESTVTEEETVDEAYMADDDDKPMEEGEYMADDDEPMEEMAHMADDDDAPAGGDMDLTALVSDIAAALEKHTGVEVEVEEGPEGDMGDEPEMDMDADADMSPDMDDMDDMGGMDDEPAEEPMEEMAHMADDDDKPMEEQEETLEEVVNMIARRVAKRILTEQ